jgi:hypothetical protein
VRDERLERDVAVTVLPSGNFHFSYFLVRHVVDQILPTVSRTCPGSVETLSRATVLFHLMFSVGMETDHQHQNASYSLHFSYRWERPWKSAPESERCRLLFSERFPRSVDWILSGEGKCSRPAFGRCSPCLLPAGKGLTEIRISSERFHRSVGLGIAKRRERDQAMQVWTDLHTLDDSCGKQGYGEGNGDVSAIGSGANAKLTLVSWCRWIRLLQPQIILGD